MERNKINYKDRVLDRLKFDGSETGDITFLYSESDILDNIEYVNWCCRNGLSPYKCLTFLHDYISGDYDISGDIQNRFKI